MKEEDWKLKFIGDNWKFLPDKEWEEKRDYDKLLYNIRRKNGKIERLKKEISDEKVLLRDLKKLRTKDFKRLVKHHKKFSPSFSY